MNYSWYLCFSCLHRVCLGKKCAPSNAENIILHLDQTSTYLQTEILIGVGQVQIRPGPRLDPRVFWETRTHPAPFLEDPRGTRGIFFFGARHFFLLKKLI